LQAIFAEREAHETRMRTHRVMKQRQHAVALLLADEAVSQVEANVIHTILTCKSRRGWRRRILKHADWCAVRPQTALFNCCALHDGCIDATTPPDALTLHRAQKITESAIGNCAASHSAFEERRAQDHHRTRAG